MSYNKESINYTYLLTTHCFVLDLIEHQVYYFHHLQGNDSVVLYSIKSMQIQRKTRESRIWDSLVSDLENEFEVESSPRVDSLNFIDSDFKPRFSALVLKIAS